MWDRIKDDNLSYEDASRPIMLTRMSLEVLWAILLRAKNFDQNIVTMSKMLCA